MFFQISKPSHVTYLFKFRAVVHPMCLDWWWSSNLRFFHQAILVRLEFMDFVLDLPQVSCGEGFQLTFDQMLGGASDASSGLNISWFLGGQVMLIDSKRTIYGTTTVNALWSVNLHVKLLLACFDSQRTFLGYRNGLIPQVEMGFEMSQALPILKWSKGSFAGAVSTDGPRNWFIVVTCLKGNVHENILSSSPQKKKMSN